MPLLQFIALPALAMSFYFASIGLLKITRHKLGYLNSYVLAFLFLFTLSTTTAFAQNPEPKDLKQALKQDKTWYAGPEGLRIAKNILLYQHDNGGWHKNINMTVPIGEKEKKEIQQEKAAGGTTIDNGATVTQMRYLQLMYEATKGEKYKTAFLKGLDFLLAAQYPNGGWPQYYPLRKGYYEHITFNDGAMIGVMRLLRDVGQGKPGFSFVNETGKTRAAKAVEKGLQVILKSQIKVNGKLTAWCAQVDRNDLRPHKARAYELPSISGGESVEIVRYLMEIEKPGTEVKQAIEGAMDWFNRAKLTGIKLIRKEDPALPKGYDLIIVKDTTAPPLWARFYDIQKNRPMFVGRDGKIKKEFSEIEHERRIGYDYFVTSPNELLTKYYPKWKEKLLTKK